MKKIVAVLLCCVLLSALFACQSHEGNNVRTTDFGALPASASDIGAYPKAVRGGIAAEHRFRQCVLLLSRDDVGNNTKNILFYGSYIVTSLYDHRSKRSTIVAVSPDGADIIKLATLSEYRHLSAIDTQTLYAGTFNAAKDQPYYINLFTGKLKAAEFSKITHLGNSYVNPYVCGGFTFYCVGDDYSDEEIYEPVISYYVKPDGRKKYIKLDVNGDWSAYEDTVYTVDFFMDDKEEFTWQFYSYRGGKQTEQIKLRNALNMDMRLIGKWALSTEEIADLETGERHPFDFEPMVDERSLDGECIYGLGYGLGKVYCKYGDELGFHSVDPRTGESEIISAGVKVTSVACRDGVIYFTTTDSYYEKALYSIMPDGSRQTKICDIDDVTNGNEK